MTGACVNVAVSYHQIGWSRIPYGSSNLEKPEPALARLGDFFQEKVGVSSIAIGRHFLPGRLGYGDRT